MLKYKYSSDTHAGIPHKLKVGPWKSTRSPNVRNHLPVFTFENSFIITELQNRNEVRSEHLNATVSESGNQPAPPTPTFIVASSPSTSSHVGHLQLLEELLLVCLSPLISPLTAVMGA